jgi:hypothetical protein
MGNTILTLGSGAITRKALSILHNKLVFVRSINRQYDDRFAVKGAKIGDTLDIRLPNEFTVRSGAVMDVQDVTENMHELTLGTQKGVDINFSSAELLLSMDEFADRILDPAMARLAAEVDKTVITAEYKKIWNMVYTTIGTGPVIADIQSGRAKMQKSLSPLGSRTALMESLGMNTVVNDGKAFFSPASEISRQYKEGLVGHMSGFEFMESELIPTHTNGTRTTAGTADLSAVSNGDTTLSLVTTDSETFVAGDVFTIAGVYAVNPETKDAYAHLQQFVVRVGATSSGSAITGLAIYPTIYKSGAKQNVYCADWTEATAATVVDLAGSSGSASTGYPQHLLYHKDAFTFVSGDLELPQGVDFAAREVYDGISMRIVRNFDIVNDKFPCRIDVFFGHTAPRPQWAVRVLGKA